MKSRRHTYIVDRKLQFRYILMFVLACLAGSMASLTLFNMLAMKRLDALIWSTHLNVESTGEILRPLSLYVNIADFIFVLLLLLLIAKWMIAKTSGPLYRMSNDVRKISGGDLSTEITLRQTDDFQSTAGELDKMTRSLRERFTIINEKYKAISGRIRNIQGHSPDDKVESSGYNLLLGKIEELEKELDRFTL